MSKLFIGICLLIHAASAAIILASGSFGIWVAMGIMLAAFAASSSYRRKSKALPSLSSARAYMRAKADMVYATFFIALAVGLFSKLMSQDLTGVHYILPLIWAGLYVLYLLNVPSDLKWAAELEEDEAEERAFKARLEAEKQDEQT